MSEYDADTDSAPALGQVVDEERGSLPYALVHGEPLVRAASWALDEAGVTPVDVGTPWDSVRQSGEAFVLHDALCPLTPPTFLVECIARAQADDVVVVGVRPVTDTVKESDEGVVRGTVDRDRLAAVASPVVLPPSVVEQLTAWPSLDLTALVTRLREEHEVVLLEAPPEGRRVASEDDVRLLESLTSPR